MVGGPGHLGGVARGQRHRRGSRRPPAWRFPGFPPAPARGYVFFTVIGVLGAVTTFALVARFARRPIRTYLTVATIALALSFIPDLMLMADPSLPGTSVPAILALMVMHIVTFAISVGLLTSLTRR